MDTTHTDSMNAAYANSAAKSFSSWLFTTNSPAPGNLPGSVWNYVDRYGVIINPAAFGSNGFGSVTIPQVHNSPSKNGTDQVSATPTSSTSTNRAIATASGGLSATASASVSITSSISPTSGSNPGGPGPGPGPGPSPSGLTVQFPGGPAANGKVGMPYSAMIGVTGGKSPYTFAITSGTLPAGLTLKASTGAITGTPTAATSGPPSSITVTVADSSSPKLTGTASGSINIAPPPPLALQLPGGPAINGTVGTPYSVSVSATGGIAPYTFAVTAGTLPAGLTLNSSTGAITGTPTAATSGPAAPITITVTDSESPAKTASANVNINIAAPPPLAIQFPGGPAANEKVGSPYSVSVTATGGITPYTFAITAGMLAPGLTLNSSTGAITGTPTAAATGPAAQVTVKVTDSESPVKTALATGNITINP